MHHAQVTEPNQLNMMHKQHQGVLMSIEFGLHRMTHKQSRQASASANPVFA